MQSILSIAQDVAVDVSLAQPSELVGDTGDGAELLRHITRTCRQLAQKDWSFLRKEQTFTTIAAQIQTSGVPGDFLRIVDGTSWNRTERRPLEGPLSPQEWASYIANVSGGIRDQFRFIGGNYEMYPAPSAGDTIAYEYIKNTIGTDSTGTTERAAFSVDTDLTHFDDELVILGALWRYKQAQGGDYSEEYVEYQVRLAELYASDGGNDKLDMSGSRVGNRIIQPRFEDWGA
jgi:hypothetical protein